MNIFDGTTQTIFCWEVGTLNRFIFSEKYFGIFRKIDSMLVLRVTEKKNKTKHCSNI
jgi:hypothetical protein